MSTAAPSDIGDGNGDAKHPSRADALRYATERAVRAPSVHNTQPWRYVIRNREALEIHADPSRRLRVLDPRGRQMTISCGCALFNIRVALAALGYDAIVERLPDRDDPEFIARVSLPHERVAWLPLGPLDDAIDRRRTNRRAFLDMNVTPDVIFELANAARAEGGVLLPITDADRVAETARLSRQADRVESADPAYLAELRAWTTDDPRRPDGAQAASIPYRGGDVSIDDSLPVREFDVDGLGWLPSSSHSDDDQCLLLMGAMGDDRLSWIRSGEAIERVWLELTQLDYAAGPLPQVIEVNSTNARLRSALGLTMVPHLLMRVGRAADMEPSKRRPIAQVVVEVD